VSRADRDPSRRPDDRAVHDPDKLSGRGCDDLHRPPARCGSNPDADGDLPPPAPGRGWNPDAPRGDLPPPTAGSAGISLSGWPAEVTPPAARPADTSLPHPWALDLPPSPATGTADHRSPHPRPPRGRPSAAAESADASPEAAWSARVLRPGAWLDGPSASAWPGGLVGGGDAGQGDLAVPGGDDVGGVGAVAAGRWDRGSPVGAALVRRPWARGASPRLRPGWYGYRPTASVELPAWAAEIAFTIERPVDGELQALALLRAPARVGWLAGMVETFAEVEVAAGVRPAAGVGSLAGPGSRRGSRLLPGPRLPGLVPVSPADAQAGLAAAGARGLPAPLRRRRPAASGAAVSWRSGAGSIVTCDGPCGMSAQAVVALGGLGEAGAITPPPGGALVLRAWRTRRSWGVASGLVIGAATALGLGRAAARAAVGLRGAGWPAVVLRGSTALDLARAGSPGHAAPVAAARAMAGPQVAALFEAFLAAGLGGAATRSPAATSPWELAVTP
jgi:hypothetical protein